MLGFLQTFAENTGQKIFHPNVRSLTVTNPNDFMAPSILRMGSNDRLDINFDIISDDREYLRYRVLHCNADWQPSRLLESEYIDGFNEVEVNDYAFSSNTYIHYINYNISLPDPELPILVSGNYLLQVFPESEPDIVLLQVPFSVSEDVSYLNGGITTRTDKGVNSEYQQLFFNVETSNFPNINPYQDLLISITQNNSPETTRFLRHPIRVENNKSVFEHAPELIFQAGNEFRRFETVRVDYPGMHVDSVKFKDGIWHAWLQPDNSRVHKEYVYDSTQHGRFKIDEYNSSDPNLSADYVMVHFTLDPGNRQYGNIYVDGDFTNHSFDETNLMRYDWNDGFYHTSIPLKQGSYNYRYTLLPEDGSNPSPASIEGNKYETQNEYLVKVYLRLPGSRADRLIGSLLLK